MATMRLEIVTAERRVYSEDVDMLVAPGIGGQLGILPNHAPLLTALAAGRDSRGQRRRRELHGG